MAWRFNRSASWVAGAWGTALAITSRRAGRDVLIWAYEPETSPTSSKSIGTRPICPGVKLDPAIEATARLNEVANCDLLLMVDAGAKCARHRRRACALCRSPGSRW